MEPERNRLKHLLIILLEALSYHGEDNFPARFQIQERVSEAGLDEADIHGLLNWIEDQWQPAEREALLQESLSESPADKSFRYFSETDLDYVSADAIGYLLALNKNGQISRIQMEALLQYASYVAIAPLEKTDLESVIEQVLFRPQRPGLTGGISEGIRSIH